MKRCKKRMYHSKASRFFYISIVCLLLQNNAQAQNEDYVYGSELTSPENNVYGSDDAEQENNCQNNDLPTSISPDVYENMQMRALRRKLWRILTSPGLKEKILIPNYEPFLHDISSQSGGQQNRWDSYFKRNIGAIMKTKPVQIFKKSIATLAKNGQLPSRIPEDEQINEDDVKRSLEYIKKSLQSLAKNSHFPDKETLKEAGNYYEYDLDQLPTIHQHYLDMGKKNIDALARNGQMHGKRNIQYVMKNGGVGAGGKRNLASLIKNHNMPDMNREEQNKDNKRNIGAIARDWALPNHSTGWNKNSEQKRNVAALLRQDHYLLSQGDNSEIYPTPDSEGQEEPKRNLASIKAGRHKRQADEYFTENAEDYNPVLHKSNGNDYDEFVRSLVGDYFYNHKRFLGNIPLSRMTELGKIPLIGQPNVSNATPTSPTYRRKQYLLSRTIPGDDEK